MQGGGGGVGTGGPGLFPKAPRFSGFDDDTGLIKRPDLARDVIRHLFKKKVEREAAERLARAQWQAVHENKCYYLKMDPAVTPMFPEVRVVINQAQHAIFGSKQENVHLFSSSIPRFDICHQTSRIITRTEQTFVSARILGVIS